MVEKPHKTLLYLLKHNNIDTGEVLEAFSMLEALLQKKTLSYEKPCEEETVFYNKDPVMKIHFTYEELLQSKSDTLHAKS